MFRVSGFGFRVSVSGSTSTRPAAPAMECGPASSVRVVSRGLSSEYDSERRRSKSMSLRRLLTAKMSRSKRVAFTGRVLERLAGGKRFGRQVSGDREVLEDKTRDDRLRV